MATVAGLLAKKGPRVHCVSPRTTVLEAVQLMARHRIGALVVTVDDYSHSLELADRVIGMFTERDVLTRVVSEERSPGTTLVEDVMTTDIAYCQPETPIEEVGAIMRQHRIRHLPICDADGCLQGLVSIGDLNAWHADGQESEIHYLNEYIHGRV